MSALNLLDFDKYRESEIERAEAFDKVEALRINQARMDHLASLALPIAGRSVVDVGCGVGHLAQFFVERGCPVLCVDGRAENVGTLRSKYPSLSATVADVERDDLTTLGRFDIVFCYGLLYHTESPGLVLQKFSAICNDMILLESCITDHPDPLVQYTEEPATWNQALRGLATRPTPSFIISMLARAGFGNIYLPKEPPQYPDFQFECKGDLSYMRDGHVIRQIFVATREAPVPDEQALQRIR
jgi:SAM-dependent methyltransferase